MIDPGARGGKVIEGLPVELEHVRDLEVFDGPLLAEFRSTTGDTYLYNWCDANRELTRWIVMRTPTQDVSRYLVGAMTLRQLITECRDRFVYLVDVDVEDQTRATFYLAIEHLPHEYLPGPESYHLITGPREERMGRYQDVFVDDHWGHAELAEYPRKYIQAYTVQALLGTSGDATPLRQIHYKLTTGYIFNTMYMHLREQIPQAKRPALAEVAMASPGYVRFRVDPLIAASLRRAIARFVADRDAIAAGIHVLSRWSNNHEPTMTATKVKAGVRDICERLEISHETLFDRAASLLVAVKALASYVRRIAFLAAREKEHSAMLVGLKRPPPSEANGATSTE